MNSSPPVAPGSGQLENARQFLRGIAYRAMVDRGLEPDFSPAALAELAAITGPAPLGQGARDLRSLLWCSIDNDDSRDLDQLSVAEALPNGATKVLVAIADVAGLVPARSALDAHAQRNTTSVYTAAEIFPMLPEKLSTNLTSLAFGAERRAIILEMSFTADGSMTGSAVYTALVLNRAKLAYNRVAAWLEQGEVVPPDVAAVPGLADNIQMQHRLAQTLRARRHMRGALSLQTIQARPVFEGDHLRDLKPDESNAAKNLIEELMVAGNGVTADYLSSKNFPSIRRVVRTPLHWDRIVELAASHGTTLPPQPDGPALESFLLARRDASPEDFPDVSLLVIKLLGAGEYVMAPPHGEVPGHFGLAVSHYAHSTAPNRRYPDLLIQRLLKAALENQPAPYRNDELADLAKHCTEREDDAKKIERQVSKSAAAMLLSSRIGDIFDAIVTGNSDKGVWVRLARQPIEGKLVGGFQQERVADRIQVRLVHTDAARGFIDFVRVGAPVAAPSSAASHTPPARDPQSGGAARAGRH